MILRDGAMVRSISILTILLATTALAGDRTPTARIALDSARQRLDVATQGVEQATRDLESALRDQQQAQQRLDSASRDFETSRYVVDDPRLLEHVSAEARAAEEVAAGREADLKAAQERLEKMPTTSPSDPQAVLAQRTAAEQQVKSVAEEAHKAAIARRDAQERERRFLSNYRALASGENIFLQEQRNAEIDLNRANRDVSNAVRNLERARDDQTRGQWGLDASDREFRLAVREAQRGDFDRKRFDNRRDDIGFVRDRSLVLDAVNPGDSTVGADRERRAVLNSQIEARRRELEAQQRLGPTRNSR
jgi:hypothetical protein